MLIVMDDQEYLREAGTDPACEIFSLMIFFCNENTFFSCPYLLSSVFMIAQNGTCHTLFSWCLICLLAQRSQDFPLCSWISEPLQSKLHISRYNDALLLVFVPYSDFFLC